MEPGLPRTWGADCELLCMSHPRQAPLQTCQSLHVEPESYKNRRASGSVGVTRSQSASRQPFLVLTFSLHSNGDDRVGNRLPQESFLQRKPGAIVSTARVRLPDPQGVKVLTPWLRLCLPCDPERGKCCSWSHRELVDSHKKCEWLLTPPSDSPPLRCDVTDWGRRREALCTRGRTTVRGVVKFESSSPVPFLQYSVTLGQPLLRLGRPE